MYKFEIGKTYLPNDSGFEMIKVLNRTPKMIKVTNKDTGSIWRMRIRTDENGDEYATDSSVPRKWRHAFTYYAERQVE